MNTHPDPTVAWQLADDRQLDTTEPEVCLCHDTVDCPNEATVAISTGQFAEIAGLLAVIDEFLRTQPGAADRLVEHFATQHDRARPPGGLRCEPGYLREQARYDVNLFIDKVSFAAHALRAHGHCEGGDR